MNLPSSKARRLRMSQDLHGLLRGLPSTSQQLGGRQKRRPTRVLLPLGVCFFGIPRKLIPRRSEAKLALTPAVVAKLDTAVGANAIQLLLPTAQTGWVTDVATAGHWRLICV
jgi:hypothetical protein